MGFVLSVIHLPEGEAKYGKVRVSPALPAWMTVRDAAFDVLCEQRGSGVSQDEAWLFAEQFMDKVGVDLTEPKTGLVLRMDKEEDAPHPCPCCGRRVLPDDHADAGAEDAFCLGCFTWDRNVPACLAKNSAHTHDQN